MIKLVAFTGAMGSGKSTAIELIKKHSGKNVYLVKFAQPLYDMQEFIYDRIKYVHQRPLNFVKDRKLLQWLGTEWGRDSISKTLWIDVWKTEVKNISENYPDSIIVCDDVRFDNEAEAVNELGGMVVRIFSDTSGTKALGSIGIASHASESGVDHNLVGYLISNNGTVEDLGKEVKTLLKNLYIFN